MASTSFSQPSSGVVVQRVLYGVLAIAVLLGLFALDATIAQRMDELGGPVSRLLRRGSVLPVLFATLLTMAAFELRRLLLATGARPCFGFACLMIVVITLTPWVSASGLSVPKPDDGFRWQFIWLAVSVAGACLLIILRRRTDGTFRDLSATLLMIAYLGLLGSFGVQLRCSMLTHVADGAWLLLAVVLITKCADIGGFFVGSAIGRHKLIPSVSPGKSIEGTIGGMVFSGLAAMLLAYVPSIVLGSETAWESGSSLTRIANLFAPPFGISPPPSLVRAFLFGAILAIVGLMGDLIESCFKRDAGSKDSGKILPRFGGILDLIDSPLLAMPVAWFLLAVIWEVI
jgi:phosphatidate cytidylyltransferase